MKSAKILYRKAKKSRKKPEYKRDEWEEIFEGCNNTFIIDPTTTKLVLSCCDCGSTHEYNFTVFKDGRIKIHLKKDCKATREIRYHETSNLPCKVKRPSRWW